MTKFEELIEKLKALFELDKADLDFGIHRIIKTRHREILRYLQGERDDDGPSLRSKVVQVLGELQAAGQEDETERLRAEIVEEFGRRAFNEAGELVNEEARAHDLGERWMVLQDAQGPYRQRSMEQLEAEVYSHLLEFFSRYYEDGDFVSLRRTRAGARPYAIPYSGEEVMLHWANKDQYYIKSSEDLKDYTFTVEEMGARFRVHFKCARMDPVTNNNKAHRAFVLDEEAAIEATDTALVVPFHFKIFERKPTERQQVEALETSLMAALDNEWKTRLNQNDPTFTGSGERTALQKHLQNYTRKNTSDYFIHKDLGGFLRQELDFYIKNEVMFLDDVDNRPADYLAAEVRKIKAIRAVAKDLIEFLAQFENFQKRLWLKKKFVTECHYCITLDRVIEHAPGLLPEIAGNEAQREEWKRLYAIDEIRAEELGQVAYAEPLTVEFLRANPYLMVDTAHFGLGFKMNLLGQFDDLDGQCEALLVNAENFQTLTLLLERYREQVKCMYIDPPYNTGGDGFVYKDAYQHASWISMIKDRMDVAYHLLSKDSVFFSSIDEVERSHLETVLNQRFGKDGRIEEIIWVQNTTKNQSPTYSTNHEYIEVFAKDRATVKADFSMFRESKPGYLEISELMEELNAEYRPVEAIEKALRILYKRHKEALQPGDVDEWKGIYNYNRAEYRDSDGRFVEEHEARVKKARIWVWREDNPSMPQIKEDSQKAEFRDPGSPTYRFYQPIHPVTGKPCPAPKRGWSWPFEPHGKQKNCFSLLAADHRIAWGDDEEKIPQTKRFLHEVETNVAKSVVMDFTDGEKEITNLFGQSRTFGGPKPTTLIQRFCDQTSLGNGLACDFFAGSGTTGEAVMKYNREKGTAARFILVEGGDHFDTVLKPRIQKVVYAAIWKDGKPTRRDAGISHCFKYLRLESYEDTLNNLELEDRSADLLGLPADVREDYLIRYMLDIETRGSLVNLGRFADPWGCTLKIFDRTTGEARAKVIDLVETFNYLLGLRVREQKTYGGFLTIEGENPAGETVLVIWRKLGGDSNWPATDNGGLKAFLADDLRVNPADTEYAAIYINGDTTLEDPHKKVLLIEEAFHTLMFADTE